MNVSTAGFDCLPVRTPTLPPATHTNVWIVGDRRLSVFDPASPWEDEQRHLFDHLQTRRAKGHIVERLVLTHHHHDHVAGTVRLQQQLQSAQGQSVPICAHPITAALLKDTVDVTEHLQDFDTLPCGNLTLDVVFTPGHAPGHLAFHDANSGVVVAGDMVAGEGSIAIDPTEGDLQDYLDSLARLRDLNAHVLLPSHGPPLEHPFEALTWYIEHRHERTEQIRVALDRYAPQTATHLASKIYPDVPPELNAVAAAQVETHLNWMVGEGTAAFTSEGWLAT